jgi:hypothetical protein
MFWPSESLKDRPRGEVLADAEARAQLLDDLYGDLTDDVVRRSHFAFHAGASPSRAGGGLREHGHGVRLPERVRQRRQLRRQAEEGQCSRDAVERHLATLYLPQLIRHVQIALESMRRAGTQFYVKIGTAGTGGMG